MKNILININFIKEQIPLLIEYECVDGKISLATVRFLKKVVINGDTYYEAVWIHGVYNINHLLSARQLVLLESLIEKELHEGHTSIPEDQIIYIGKQ